MAVRLRLCECAILTTVVLSIAVPSVAAPPDLVVTATFPEEPTGTMHYAEGMTLAVGTAKPLVLDGPMLPLPGPQFRLADSRFLLLGWSSPGGGMQAMHVLLISVRENAVVLDRELIAGTDRASAGLLVRIRGGSARIGFPEPPRDFVHDEDEWFLNLGGSNAHSLDFKQMRSLVFETVGPVEGDLFYDSRKPAGPAPKRVAWIEVTHDGFALTRHHGRQ